MLGSRVAWLAPLALTACSFAPIGLEGRECPCVSGYRCEASRCVRDTTPDAAPGDDATTDVTPVDDVVTSDVPQPESGADVTLTESGADAAIDAPADVPGDIPADVPADAPVDAPPDGPPDGVSPCITASNVYGPATNVFLLPITPTTSYVGDVQAAYPQVDWANLDRLYIPAGTYGGIYLGNMPMRSLSRPLVITNHGGQVTARSMSITGGSGWVLTGHADSGSQTGDPGFPGHAGGAYANSQGRYGIYLRADDGGLAGLSVEGNATDFEVEYLEVFHGWFASIVVRTDTGDMQNIRVHDTYEHDGEGTGIWFAKSSTGTGVFRNVRVDHNRIARMTSEAVLFVATHEGCRLDHNAMILPSTDWLNGPGAAWAMSLSPERDLEVDHNVLAGAASGFFEIQLSGGGTTGLAANLHDEWYADSYASVGSVRTGDTGELSLNITNNRFGRVRYGFGTIYPGSTAPDPLLGVEPPNNAIAVTNNQYEPIPTRLLAQSGRNVTASNNTQTALGAIPFVDALPGDDASYDLPAVEFWSPTQNRVLSMTTRTYALGDRVTRLGHIYECIVTASTNEPPETTPTSWRDLGLPPDDLRVSAASCDVGAP